MKRKAGVLFLAGLGGLLVACTPSAEVDGLDWAQYPAHANVSVDSVVSGRGESAMVAHGDELLEEVRSAISAKFAIEAWDDRYPEKWVPFGGNGYGGSSMLVGYVSPIWEGAADISPSEWASVIEVVRDIADRDGMTEMDFGDTPPSEWKLVGSFHDGLEYLEVIVQDAALNAEELRTAEADDLLISGIVLSYGATTVRASDLPAFRSAAEPYVGRERPDPITSD